MSSSPVTFGRYVLLEKLASGGMAEIFLAKAVGEAGFEKALVIKRVLPHLTLAPDFVEMFLDEARIAAQLSHPGIVQIFDLGKADDDYFFAMEYLAGEDLSAISRQCRQLGRAVPLDIAVKIASATAEALHFAHEFRAADGRPMGIVHRDISPSNVLVTYHGSVKILDFGIARAHQRIQQTRAGQVKGKAAYMAPEQGRGETVDRRADVWSLGVCLHEMITGRRLFLKDTSSDTMTAVHAGPIPRPRDLLPGINSDLDELIMSALERDPAKRMPSAEVFRRGLEHYLADHTYVPQLVHLGEFMREIFGPERAAASLARASAAHSSEPGRGAEKSGSSDLEEDRKTLNMRWPRESSAGDSLLSSSSRVGRRGPTEVSPRLDSEGEAAGREEATEGSQTDALPATGTPRRKMSAVLLMAAPLLVAAGWFGFAEIRGARVTSAPSVTSADVRVEAPEVPAEAPEVRVEAVQIEREKAAPVADVVSLKVAEPEDPAPASPPAPEAAAREALASGEKRARVRTASVEDAQPGTLVVRAEGDASATLWLGSRRLGALPVKKTGIKPGTYTLRLENAPLGVSQRERIQIKAGQVLTRTFTLRTGKVNVLVDPWADVFVRGSKLGQTPLAGRELVEGRHVLRLVNPSGEKSVTVNVVAGATAVVRESLH